MPASPKTVSSKLERKDLCAPASCSPLSMTDSQFPQAYTQHVSSIIVNEQRVADYIVVPKDAAGVPPPPTDAQLTGYVAAHAARFSTPEYRDVIYAVAGPQDVMNQVHITDDAIAATVRTEEGSISNPEKREVEQITFPDEASAKAARAKIDAGQIFDQIVFQRGLKSDRHFAGHRGRGRSRQGPRTAHFCPCRRRRHPAYQIDLRLGAPARHQDHAGREQILRRGQGCNCART